MAIGERRSSTLNVAGSACGVCKSRLSEFSRLRIYALLALAGGLAALLWAVPHVFDGSTLAVLTVIGALVAMTVTMRSVLLWHRRTACSLLTHDMQTNLLRQLPDLGGVIAWRAVRVFPGRPERAIELADLR
ncbi:MAG TPA: hypothetical protein VGM90_32315 [Kofleriaceae bacterium]